MDDFLRETKKNLSPAKQAWFAERTTISTTNKTVEALHKMKLNRKETLGEVVERLLKHFSQTKKLI